MGSNISVSTRTGEVLRILPRINEAINEEWLADKSRFACDGLKRQRLIAPMVRNECGELVPVEWESALLTIANRIECSKGDELFAISGGFSDVESMVAVKDLLSQLGAKSFTTEHQLPAGATKDRTNYILNSGIEELEKADFILLIGTNPRYEAPLLNTRIRKGYVQNETNVALVGPKVDLSYKYEVRVLIFLSIISMQLNILFTAFGR